MRSFLVSLFVLLSIPLEAKSNLAQIVDFSAKYFTNSWLSSPALRKIPPPQVIALPKNTPVWGGCGSGSSQRRSHVAGSQWCPATNTISLTLEDMVHFYSNFGNSAVFYVVAHEYAHALQTAYRIRLKPPLHELQADCLAGMFTGSDSQRLGVTRNDVIAMSHAAYSIGGKTHGTGAQRAYALLSGMGVFKTSCSPADIAKIANSDVNNQVLNVLRTRSGLKQIDTTKTPYPKTFKGFVDSL